MGVVICQTGFCPGKAGVCPCYTVSGAGNLCWQIRISTCTVTILESVVSLLLTPVTGSRRQQQSLSAQCVWLADTEKGTGGLIDVADALTEPYIS